MSHDLLVTGANGQLGWEACRLARKAGWTVIGLNRDTLDITDPEAVDQAVRYYTPRAILNAAAYTAVDCAEQNVETAEAVNVGGAAALAKAAAASGAFLLHVSTDYVFDGSATTAYTEDAPTAPLSVYGRTKLAGEYAVRRLCPRHVILRTSWVFGVHGANFVKTMLRLARERDVLRVVADQRGGPTFARDLAAASMTIIENLRAADDTSALLGTFHCAGTGTTTWHGLAERTVEQAAPWLGRRPKVDAITTAEFPTLAERPANSVLDCSRLHAIHGIALRPWQEALDEMLQEVGETEAPDIPRISEGS